MGKGVWGVSVPKMALVLLPKMALNLQIRTYPGNRLHAKPAVFSSNCAVLCEAQVLVAIFLQSAPRHINGIYKDIELTNPCH